MTTSVITVPKGAGYRMGIQEYCDYNVRQLIARQQRLAAWRNSLPRSTGPLESVRGAAVRALPRRLS